MTTSVIIRFFQLIVSQKEDAFVHSAYFRILEHGFVIVQFRVNGRDDQTSHFRTHPVLDTQYARFHSVADQTLKKRYVQIVILGQMVNCSWWFELLMITCELKEMSNMTFK